MMLGRTKSSDSLAVGLLGLALGLGLGCREAAPVATPSDPDVVVARYIGGEIRRGEIQQALDANLVSVAQPAAPEIRREIVRKIVERRVRTGMLLAEALEKGYASRPEILLRQAAAEDRVLAEDLLETETAGAAAADGLVVAEVDRRLAAAQPVETRKFSHIYLRAAEADPEARERAAALMAKIQADLAAGASFNDLAEQHSTSAMARGGGRIDWTLRASLHPAGGDAVFGLGKEGDVSPVVATPDGLHLFRLDGIREPAAVDAVAIRTAVRAEFDAEAKSAAKRGRRDQEVDAHLVEFAAPEQLEALDQPGATPGPAWVARWQGTAGSAQGAGEVTEAEIVALRGWVLPKGQPLDAELRRLVENRLLAEVRRGQGTTPETAAQIAQLREQVVIDSYRGDLIAALDTPATDDEIAAFHRDNAETATFLRDYEVDALFFPQSTDSVADVYAAGEWVGTQLREGRSFDAILDQPGRAEAQTCRAAHGADLESIGSASIRLRKAIVNLAEGEISPALYLERPVVVVPGVCEFTGRGVVFVRLRNLGTLPVEAARPAIAAALSKLRVDEGVAAIQARLIAASQLEILVPEG